MTTTKQKYLNNVLLIDSGEIDNYINRKVLENCCASNILTFESPLKALQFLEQTTFIPQLILLDLYFPAMDGFEFIDEFRKLKIAKHSIDIFILSIYLNPEDIVKAQEKCSGFIEKCLTKEKLFTQLNSLATL